MFASKKRRQRYAQNEKPNQTLCQFRMFFSHVAVRSVNFADGDEMVLQRDMGE